MPAPKSSEPLSSLHYSVSLSLSGMHLRSADEETHWAFDPRGHVLAGYAEGAHYQVGLGADVLRRSGSPGSFELSRLGGGEVEALFERVAADAGRALEGLESNWVECTGPLAPPALGEVRASLERAAQRGSVAFRADREAFAAVYRPVRILPPDCYRALLIQLTEGCSHNRCTFCTLYRDVPFRIKTVSMLEQHLAGIEALLGSSLSLRTRIFLGDANACLVPQRRLLPALERIRGRFPRAAAGGFHAFTDAFTPPGKTRAELEELVDAGLRRVTLGLESGHAPLLSWLEKPSSPANVLDAVERFKAAGLTVAVTVLVGAGGERYAEPHLADTVQAIEAMQLGSGDAVYLSPFRPRPGAPYAEKAERDGVTALGEDELALAQRAFRNALAGQRCKVALYDVERWIY